MTPSHFCDYLSFEEDMALYLKTLKFPSPQGYRMTGYFSGNLILALLAVVLVTLKIINANKTFKISMN
jgi:hypothetical protein